MTAQKDKLETGIPNTWCPGCFNFQILAGVKNAIANLIKSGKKKDEIAIVAGIGCHAKIFDYLNLNGINSLHGRVLPTLLGMKIGNPNLNLIGFSGDGDAYAEGMEHLIHMARYNADVKYIVHNNQVFALTVGEPSPVTEQGFTDKSNPSGVKLMPLNTIKLMLGAGCGFVARVFADVKQISEVLEEAFRHKGFAFIEVIQPCIIFHSDLKFREHTYLLNEKNHNNSSWEEAMKKAGEFDYNSVNGKIPLGVFYKKERQTFEELYPQLSKMKKEKKSWKDIKR